MCLKMGCLCFKSTDHSILVRELSVTNSTATGVARLNHQWRAGRWSADVCGLQQTKIIIHSGTHYTEVRSLTNRVSICDKKRLREVCRHGDHYLAQDYVEDVSESPNAKETKNFYIIKGNSCIEVKNLSCNRYSVHRDRPMRIFDLHPECQGGSHYFANEAGFYIIHSQNNTYLHVLDMSEHGYRPYTASRHKLHESLTNGLHYFATHNYFYVVKEHSEFGLVYHRTEDLRTNANTKMLTVSPSISSIIYRSASLNQQRKKVEISESTTQVCRGTSSATAVEITSEVSGSVNDMSTPNSGNLTVIKWKNERGEVKTFHLKASIIHKWRQVGDHVVPWETLEVWAQEKDSEACCKDVLSYWLNNPPPNYPATWEGLYELLRDCELSQMAAKLKQAVENAI